MNPERRRTPVPDISLERYLLSELPERETAEMNQRLDEDEELRARLEALRRSSREISKRYPAQEMGRQIETRLDEGKKARSGREPREPREKRWVLAGVLATAAVLILLTLPVSLLLDRGGERTSPAERVKGLEPRIVLFRKTASGSERLEDGASAKPGDLIRIAYQALDQSYGVILSVDGRGTITRHFPEQGERAIRLKKDGLTLLPSSYELDDAPSWERFYFVTADAPFDLAPVIRAAHDVALDRPVGGPESLALPENLRQFVISLEKGTQR